jgi:septum formation protein
MTVPCLILASASPRRRELMSYLQLPYTVVPSQIPEEPVTDMRPAEVARHLARAKAEVVGTLHPDCAVIAADTVVAIDDTILGKPVDAADALRMLQLLAGRWHEVTTGVAVWRDGHVWQDAVTARVYMRAADEAELRAYVATGEPMDKAGAYAIQGLGASLVDRVDGCYLTVVGFPLCAAGRLLAAAGITPSLDAAVACCIATQALQQRARLLSTQAG